MCLRERTRLRFLASRVASFPWPGNKAMSRVSLIAIVQAARSPTAARHSCRCRWAFAPIIRTEKRRRQQPPPSHASYAPVDPSLSMRMHVNGNYNGNCHIRTHTYEIQRMEREESSHTRLHTHMSVHCG